MGQDPDAIRQDIEQTRNEMGETIDALGYKTDVKSRAKESISGRTGQAKEGAKQAVGVAQENPLGLALGAVAVGFVAGMLLPSTRVEDEKMGEAADQVKQKAMETGQEAMERGKDVAQQTAQSAKETAQEQGQQQAQEMAGSPQA